MQTRQAHRAGTTTYRLTIFVKTPCEGLGNMGLEGFHEDYMGYEHYATEAAAKRALAPLVRETQAKYPDGEVMHAEIIETRWDEDWIDDREYGQVRDAIPVETFRRYGYPEGNRWRWDADRAEVPSW